jgi:hypothetical protein
MLRMRAYVGMERKLATFGPRLKRLAPRALSPLSLLLHGTRLCEPGAAQSMHAFRLHSLKFPAKLLRVFSSRSPPIGVERSTETLATGNTLATEKENARGEGGIVDDGVVLPDRETTLAARKERREMAKKRKREELALFSRDIAAQDANEMHRKANAMQSCDMSWEGRLKAPPVLHASSVDVVVKNEEAEAKAKVNEEAEAQKVKSKVLRNEEAEAKKAKAKVKRNAPQKEKEPAAMVKKEKAKVQRSGSSTVRLPSSPLNSVVFILCTAPAAAAAAAMLLPGFCPASPLCPLHNQAKCLSHTHCLLRNSLARPCSQR